MSSTSPAVGRALDVLLHLASRPGPVQGSALIRDIGMPRSSAYHLLEVLIERGFVVHLPDQRAYALGFSAFEVGSAYLRHAPLEHIARPILNRFVAAVGDAGRPVAAFSVTRREDRPNTELPALVGAVRGAARQLTQALSGRAPDGWFS